MSAKKADESRSEASAAGLTGKSSMKADVDESRGAKSITGPLTAEQQEQLEQAKRQQTGFVVIGKPDKVAEDSTLPYWRILMNIDVDPPESVGFDLYGPLTLGRTMAGEEPESDIEFFDLSPYGAADRGVSRRHLELRPTPHGLFAVDLDSTNGTFKNGVPFKANSPTPVGNRDTISLGLLHLTIEIIDAPQQQDEWFARQASLGQAMAEMAKTVTTQLKVEDVLNTVVDYARGLTQAQEASLWLLEPNMRELRLEAVRGIEEDLVSHVVLPLTGSIAGEAILTGKPQIRVRDEVGKKVIIADDYLVDAIIFVPVALGGLALGVLSVSNRTPGHEFTERDEMMLVALADFTATALQNSRTLEATDEALRESLRSQREATAKALESTRLKTEFLQNVSHELRSPLHTINGFTQILLRESLGPLTPEMHDAVDRIQNSGKQLLEMVDDLLDSLRIEAQELDLAHEEFSPRALVGETVAGQEPVAGEKGLLMSWSAEPDVPESLMGDPGRVQQVLLNLIANAIKFTDQGGVSVHVRTMGTFMWSISVADTGKGIPADKQEIVFERFRQEDSSSTRKYGGVGLGLAISRDLIKMMGGDLRITSEGVPGKGSIFTMTLPIIPPGQQLVIVDDDDTLMLASGTNSGVETPESSGTTSKEASSDHVDGN